MNSCIDVVDTKAFHANTFVRMTTDKITFLHVKPMCRVQFREASSDIKDSKAIAGEQNFMSAIYFRFK